ncbi:hypothetical protein JHW43_002733 [Diplocarpon mali]|nr:hypothetical protein JHW43_002733 [Diplocarpon mali]
MAFVLTSKPIGNQQRENPTAHSAQYKAKQNSITHNKRTSWPNGHAMRLSPPDKARTSFGTKTYTAQPMASLGAKRYRRILRPWLKAAPPLRGIVTGDISQPIGTDTQDSRVRWLEPRPQWPITEAELRAFRELADAL